MQERQAFRSTAANEAWSDYRCKACLFLLNSSMHLGGFENTFKLSASDPEIPKKAVKEYSLKITHSLSLDKRGSAVSQFLSAAGLSQHMSISMPFSSYSPPNQNCSP